MTLAQKVHTIMHQHNIHSTTIQPEFVNTPVDQQQPCELQCDIECADQWCCPPEKTPLLNKLKKYAV